MVPSKRNAKTSALRLLEDLPGIADVVWGTVTRLARARVPTNVLFTAPERSAGTSVLACATAIGLAQHQRVPVCLIETNLRRPALAGYLGLENAGLSDVLDGRVDLEDCLQEPCDCPGLLVLPAGTPRDPVPGEFTTERLTSILARLEQRCHYLVLDSAPLLEHVESRLLLRHADGVLLVLRARATRLSDAERAHDILVESGAPVLGSIFNSYKTRGLFAGSGRTNRPFEMAGRAEWPRASVPPSAPRGEAASVVIGESPAERKDLTAATNGDAIHANRGHFPTNGGPIPSNGGPAIELLAQAQNGSEESHLRQIDILERRIVKLTHQLEQTEADLLRLAAMKNIDLGIASIYRSVQGLSSEEAALALKRSLMQKIFQANLELKTAMARHPSLPRAGAPE
jgi:Mrp family chromosome partitioning ATPase